MTVKHAIDREIFTDKNFLSVVLEEKIKRAKIFLRQSVCSYGKVYARMHTLCQRVKIKHEKI